MTVYSSSSCPRCKVLKMKMDKANLNYDVVEDIEIMKEKGIKSIPVVELEDGRILDFSAAIAFVRDMEAAQ